MKKGPLGASWKLLALNDVEAFKPHHQPGPALCCRPEVCGEAEELAEGGKALHKLEPRVVEDVFNFPAARAEQADGGRRLASGAEISTNISGSSVVTCAASRAERKAMPAAIW